MKAASGLVVVVGIFILWKWLGGTGAPSMDGLYSDPSLGAGYGQPGYRPPL